VPMEEKIQILVLLSTDKDEAIRSIAFNTLQKSSDQELRQVLANPATPMAVLNFAINHLAPGRKDLTQALLDNPTLPADLRDWVKDLLQIADEEIRPNAAPTPAMLTVTAAELEGQPERQTLLQKIGRMSAAEKIKAALTGNQEERLVLIRDSNKIVSRAVLQSPKVSDSEIENIASMKSVSEEILRLVATNRKYLKNYNVVRQLINNPRTPIDIGLRLINRLNARDLKGLILNRNIADVVRGLAEKMIKQKEEAQKPKLPGRH
jgi:hypothetical protein